MSIATFYEANAGTGKTRTLTEFILKAVEAGTPLERICALTFTDKAANEMLDRLRASIAKLISEDRLEPLQLRLAARCFIGTFHSFCLQLLKRFAPELALPPIFEIDPQEEKFNNLFENRWDKFLSQFLASPSPADQEIIRSLGVTTLRLLSEQLVKTRHTFELNSDNLQWLADQLANSKKWGFRNNTWAGFTTRLAKDYQQHRDVLTAIVQTKKLYREPEYHARLRDLLACKNVELHRAVTLLKERFTKPFLQEYHGAGYVLYDDLLRFARQLLDKPHVRREIKNRYDLVLVDEMQDTDAIQYEIILYLCEKKDQHQIHTLKEISEGTGKFELEPQKLFVVGDPKQSIYGFRNADLSAYESVKVVLKNSGADILPLDKNYRSCPNLVEFSNTLAGHLFPLMKPHDSEGVKTELCPEKGLNDCVHFVRIYSPDKERLHLRILSEANWIARKIRALVDSGAARFQDFGVLLRKLVHSHLYVDALAAHNIPVIIEGERFFYRSQEVIDFINLLKFIVDENDDIALAGVLRSPLFGMTDRECALFFNEYRKKNGMICDALQCVTKRKDLLRLMDNIFEIRKQIYRLSPAALIDLVLKTLPVLSVAGLAYGNYRSTLAPFNILRIHKYAIELESDPANNLFHFVSMLTEFSREGRERPQEPLADEGLDAVRMMSIHNSKGLDFPYVIMPLTDYDIRSSSFAFTEILHDWSSGESGLKINGITESNYLKLKYDGSVATDSPDRLEEEEKRVLYVAATRAQKELYFCCLENGSGKDILQLLQNSFPFLKIEEEASAATLQHATSMPAEYQPLDPVLQKWKRIEEAADQTAGPQLTSVTVEAEKLEPGDAEVAEIAALAKRSGGTLVGLLCHSALEKWDFRHASDIDHVLRMEAGKYSRNFTRQQIDRATAASAEILRAFAASKPAKWLMTAEIIGREVPIVYFDRTSQSILSGKIDLLVKDETGYCVIDYKTDRDLTESMKKRYATQMRLYRNALAESISVPPTQIATRLLLVRTSEFIDIS